MSDNMTTLLKILEEADCLYTENEIINAIDGMAEEITSVLEDKNPIVVCVMKGGVFLTAYLSSRLCFPLQIDYCHVTRYQGECTGKELQFRVPPSLKMEGRSVLIVDDILDEGQTLLELVKEFKSQKAQDVYTAVLIDKTHDRKVKKGFKADFTGLKTPDRYLFGFGMDYKEYWRNLPRIYAVKE